MHIAIEGMDGVGKTSQACAVADALNCEFIAKSFHEMNDPSGKYDNYVTFNSFTDQITEGTYGLKTNYYLRKIRKEDIVTDRFYISNYWSRAKDFSPEYFEAISRVWGKPDLFILLYANPTVLYERIAERDPSDKDLWKTEVAEKAYGLMLEFIQQLSLNVLMIDSSSLEFDETRDIILMACREGVEKCFNAHSDCCTLFTPSRIRHGTLKAKYVIEGNRLNFCFTEEEEISIPYGIKSLDERCFEECKKLRRLFIPASVEYISDYTFSGTAISEIEVESENSYYTNEENFLTNKEKNKLIRYFDNGNTAIVIIPEGIEILGNLSFFQCTHVEKIILPSSLKEIRFGVFVDCLSLKEIIYEGEKLHRVRSGAFIGCEKLRKIKFTGNDYFKTDENCLKTANNDIIYYYGSMERCAIYELPECKYIYPYAYYKKLNASVLIIPDSVRKIGSNAFEGCQLKKIILGESVRDIGEKSFYGTAAHSVRIASKKYPETWKNSFDEIAEIIVLEKKEDMLCGSACLRYLANKSGVKFTDIPNMEWMAELGIYLISEFRWSVKMVYHDSRLMNDYYNGKIPQSMKIRELIDNYLHLKGGFKEKLVNENHLKQYLKTFNAVILNLRSDLLNDDQKMEAQNHFVILEACHFNQATIIVPGKIYLYRRKIDMKKLLSALNGNGQWIILTGDANESN